MLKNSNITYKFHPNQLGDDFHEQAHDAFMTMAHIRHICNGGTDETFDREAAEERFANSSMYAVPTRDFMECVYKAMGNRNTKH